MTTEPDTKAGTGPRGIGGWLLLPLGGLLFASMFGLWVVGNIVSFPPVLEMVMTFDPPSLGINTLGVLVFWAFLPLLPIALLFVRSRRFPGAFIAVTVAGALFGVAYPMIEGMDYGLDTSALVSVNTILPAVWAVGWSWYMLKSARVRNTFVN